MSKITVLKSNKTVADKGYDVVELAYKTDDGKTKGMKILGFKDQKEIAVVATNAKPGDVLEATFAKNERGYWNFSSLKNTGETDNKAHTPSTAVDKGVARGTWETSDERAARQALISKQAVLNTSVAFFEAAKVKPSKEDVVEVAKYFLEFVNNKVAQTGDVQ